MSCHWQQEPLLENCAIRVDFRKFVRRVGHTYALEILINTVNDDMSIGSAISGRVDRRTLCFSFWPGRVLGNDGQSASFEIHYDGVRLSINESHVDRNTHKRDLVSLCQ